MCDSRDSFASIVYGRQPDSCRSAPLSRYYLCTLCLFTGYLATDWFAERCCPKGWAKNFVIFTAIYTDTILVIVVIPDYDSGINKGMVLTDTVWEGN